MFLPERRQLGVVDNRDPTTVGCVLESLVDVKNLRAVAAAPYPPVTGNRPPDQLIFDDKYTYLRLVLNNADWDGVARWYATQINDKLKSTTNASQFFELSQLNLQSYCDRQLGIGDLRAFTERCMYPMIISDLGTKVGFGTDIRLPQGSCFLSRAYNFFTLRTLFVGYSGGYVKIAAAVKAGARANFSLGWIREPESHLVGQIIAAVGYGLFAVAAAAAIVQVIALAAAPAAAAAPAIAAPIAAPVVVAAAPAVIAAPVVAVAAPIIETVVVTAAPVILGTAGVATVAAGIAAGAIAVAAAPAPISPPSISAPPEPVIPPPPIIETVVTQASALPAISVAPTAALVSVAAAPAIFAPPSTTIETVTVEGNRPPQIDLDPATVAAIGVESIAIPQPDISLPSEPELPEIDDSLTDQLKAQLKKALESLGGDLLKSQLEKLLAEKLRREATPEETEYFEDYIDSLPRGASPKPPIVPIAGATQKLLLAIFGIVLAVLLLRTKRRGIKRRR